jgi:hypothetical protein
MTALPERQVERTFSEAGRFSTGLPGQKALEAGCEDFGDLSNPTVGVWVAGPSSRVNCDHSLFPQIRGRLNRSTEMSIAIR